MEEVVNLCIFRHWFYLSSCRLFYTNRAMLIFFSPSVTLLRKLPLLFSCFPSIFIYDMKFLSHCCFYSLFNLLFFKNCFISRRLNPGYSFLYPLYSVFIMIISSYVSSLHLKFSSSGVYFGGPEPVVGAGPAVLGMNHGLSHTKHTLSYFFNMQVKKILLFSPPPSFTINHHSSIWGEDA